MGLINRLTASLGYLRLVSTFALSVAVGVCAQGPTTFGDPPSGLVWLLKRGDTEILLFSSFHSRKDGEVLGRLSPNLSILDSPTHVMIEQYAAPNQTQELARLGIRTKNPVISDRESIAMCEQLRSAVPTCSPAELLAFSKV